MIEHIFIKNYKAFERENIPLEKNILFVGTNSSGKTTILEALDLFFNDDFHYEYIRNKGEDVIIEIVIEEERYRKVYSPPNYNINFKKCIGNLFEINHIKYLYVPKSIDTPKLLNDILTINLTSKLTSEEHARVFKVFDYLDGVVGNDHFPLSKIQTKYEVNINKNLHFDRKKYTKIVSNATYPYLVIGIDNFENNFLLNGLKEITNFTYQTIFTSEKKEVVSHFDYSVVALYKDDIVNELETLTKTMDIVRPKKLLLVEGKYDVAWFETALRLLGKFTQYRVIPCGGVGNIQYIKQQLEKEGYQTIGIIDGDSKGFNPLRREVIELYADIEYINTRFHTSFSEMPRRKREFFKQFSVKDDVVKKVLSSWARKNLKQDSAFVQEVEMLLNKEGY